MSLEHVNRRGDRYFVLQGKTKTGKPKYYASKKNDGTPVEELPAEMEIFEHADSAVVSIRKRKLSRITPQQRELICNRIRELTNLTHFRVDIDGDDLIVYIADRNPNEFAASLASILGGFPAKLAAIGDVVAQHCRYSAKLKFTLIDPVHEEFAVSGFCDRGSIDDWMLLNVGRSLRQLADRYLPHLGKESYFDLK